MAVREITLRTCECSLPLKLPTIETMATSVVMLSVTLSTDISETKETKRPWCPVCRQCRLTNVESGWNTDWGLAGLVWVGGRGAHW